MKRPRKKQRISKTKEKENEEKNEETVQEKLVQFLLDSGRLSHPSKIDEIRDELITEEHTSKFVKNWKRYMEPRVIYILILAILR